MMQQWQQEGANAPGMKDMMSEWAKVWNEEAHTMGLQQDQPKIIQFQAENKFMNQDVNLLAKAKELIENGQIQEAILCLEAEVQKN